MSSTQDSPGGIWRLLWPHLRPQLALVLLAFAVALLIAVLAAAQPLLTRWIVDVGLIGRDFRALAAGCLAMLGLAGLGFLLGALHRVLYVRASGRALFALRGSIYAHLMQVSPRRLAGVPVGDLVSRLDADVAEVQRFGTDALASFVTSVLTLVAVAAVMVRLSWQLSLIVAALLPLQVLVRHVARPRLEASTRLLREAAARLSGFLVETLSAARAVQSAAGEAREGQRLGSLGEAYLGHALRQQLVVYATSSAAGLLGHLATAAAFLAGGWYVAHGVLTVGTLIAFVAYLGRSSGSASSMASLYSGYQRARISLQRVEELRSLPRVERDHAEEAAARPAGGELAFESVTVRGAAADTPLLDAVTLKLPAGTKVVLSGDSGVGKSTLADLLRRFIDPDAGCIRLDGRKLQAYDLPTLRRAIAVVEHSPSLYAGTVLDNLTYATQASEAQAIAAATAAGLHEFIVSLPDGYRSQVGQGGANLSTGQRQRLAIARLVLADPLVVVLDEATSGLDAASAAFVHRALDEAFAGRTRLLISHRADQIATADVRWHLDAGRIVVSRDSRS